MSSVSDLSVDTPPLEHSASRCLDPSLEHCTYLHGVCHHAMAPADNLRRASIECNWCFALVCFKKAMSTYLHGICNHAMAPADNLRRASIECSWCFALVCFKAAMGRQMHSLFAACLAVGASSGFRAGNTTLCLSLHLCHHQGQLKGPVQAQRASIGSHGLQLRHLCWP